MTILLRMPKDLGEGVLCASAVTKLKEYALEQNKDFQLTGSKLMHGWIETFSGETLSFVEEKDIQKEALSVVVDFNIHEPSSLKDLDVVYYGLENIEHLQEPNAGFDDGAILAPTHIVHMMEETLQKLGALEENEELAISAIPQRLTRPEMVDAVYEKLGIDGEKPVALLIPACAPNRPKKRWAPENFAKIAEFMEGEGLQPVLIGGPTEDEKQLCSYIKEISNAEIINACGQTKIDELCTLASASSLAIGGDTGPVHLCAASGVETFALFGKGSDPNSWRPLSKEDAAHSIWVENLAELTPEEVWSSVEVVRKLAEKQTDLDRSF